MGDRQRRLERAHVYLVCDERTDSFLEAALRGGVDVVQLRMKSADDDEILESASRFAKACAAHEALLILNDRPDLAVRADADGVHVGQDDLPVPRVRAIVGSDRLVGLSTHTPAQIDVATAAEVDYIGVGPVHATPTKPGRPATGWSLVSYASTHFEKPFFAIGGIHESNLTAAKEAGASRIAVVRALTESEDPERSAQALRQALALRSEPVGAT